MQQYRTDLAVEARELYRERAGETTKLRGVRARERQRRGFPVTRVDILDQEGAEALGKPVGSYRTVDLSPYFAHRSGQFLPAVKALSEELGELLPEEGPVFVAGLGNRAMTPDAVGPLAVEHLLITRHLKEILPDFRPTSAAAAGVLGTTGLESAEWVRGLSQASECAAVVVIDALAARSLQRLCTTIQLSRRGIIPGSGVGNRGLALNEELLGVPVISVGVPTVVDARTLALDLLGGGEDTEEPAALAGKGASLFVTPKDVDAQVREIGKILGYGISLALQPGLAVEDLTALLE